MHHTTFALLAFAIILLGAFLGIGFALLVCKPSKPKKENKARKTKKKKVESQQSAPSAPVGSTPPKNPLRKIDKSFSYADMGGDTNPDVLATHMHSQDSKYNSPCS